MQIKLENIGIVKNSSIALNGLTVITGKNNSGKSTVGKTLYALLDSVSNISEKFEKDKCNYIKKTLDEIGGDLHFFQLVKAYNHVSNGKLLDGNSFVQVWTSGKYHELVNSDELESFIREAIHQLKQFDIKNILVTKKMPEFIARFYQAANGRVQTELIEQEFHNAIFRMGELLETIKRDPQQIAYRKESINQTLHKEFAGQIQPIRGQSGSSSIMLSENDKIYFHITVENNCIENNTENQFKPVQYKKVYLIDDPFILDNLERDKKLNQLFFNSEESLLNSGHILSHNDKLRLTLTESKPQSIFEQTVLNDKLKNIREKIDQILPGTFELSSEGRYYVQNGVKLQISNLATGSKMFSIIKILLDKGELGDSTMLILDEPEAHLHPMWQNAFAEIIVLLVKELRVNVLLTTHSPNFVLALDAYMRKYRLEEKSNFYQTQILEDGFVQYNCMDDDIGKIYEDFLRYLSEVKMLRSFYMRHGEEIESDEGMDEEG